MKLNGIVIAHFPDVLTGPYANFNGYEKAAMCTKTPNKELSLCKCSKLKLAHYRLDVLFPVVKLNYFPQGLN